MHLHRQIKPSVVTRGLVSEDPPVLVEGILTHGCKNTTNTSVKQEKSIVTTRCGERMTIEHYMSLFNFFD